MRCSIPTSGPSRATARDGRPPRRRLCRPRQRLRTLLQLSVGAALRAANGRVHAGCNVENAAFPQGQCAEASAIGAMVAAGDREIVEAVVIGGGPDLCSPCGGCRQRLAEFAAPETPIHLCGPEGLRRTVTLGELLPFAFSDRNLGAGRPRRPGGAPSLRRPRPARCRRARVPASAPSPRGSRTRSRSITPTSRTSHARRPGPRRPDGARPVCRRAGRGAAGPRPPLRGLAAGASSAGSLPSRTSASGPSFSPTPRARCGPPSVRARSSWSRTTSTFRVRTRSPACVARSRASSTWARPTIPPCARFWPGRLADRPAAADRGLPRPPRPKLRDPGRDPRLPNARRRPRRHVDRARDHRRPRAGPEGCRDLGRDQPRRRIAPEPLSHAQTLAASAGASADLARLLRAALPEIARAAT